MREKIIKLFDYLFPKHIYFFSPNFLETDDPHKWIWAFRDGIDNKNEKNYHDLYDALNRMKLLRIDIKSEIIRLEIRGRGSLSTQEDLIKLSNKYMSITMLIYEVEHQIEVMDAA